MTTDAVLRLLSRFELTLGALCVVVGGYFLLQWWTADAVVKDQLGYQFLGGALGLPLGIILCIAGATLRLSHPARWIAQLLPAAWVVGSLFWLLSLFSGLGL